MGCYKLPDQILWKIKKCWFCQENRDGEKIFNQREIDCFRERKRDCKSEINRVWGKYIVYSKLMQFNRPKAKIHFKLDSNRL